VLAENGMTLFKIPKNTALVSVLYRATLGALKYKLKYKLAKQKKKQNSNLFKEIKVMI